MTTDYTKMFGMNENDKKVLMNAVTNGKLKAVQKAFQNHFVDFDENYFDYKLLVAACKRNDGSDIINFLLHQTTCRASNPFRVRAEETPLHIVMKQKKKGFINSLLRKGASFFDKDENGEIPALVGLKSKNNKGVCKLLTLWKPDCRPDNMDYILYFHIACVTNCLHVVEYCLQCGVNPNDPLIINFEEYCNLNPVHYALQNRQYELFELLVRYGVDLSIKNIDGLSPLHFFYYANKNNNKCRIIKIFESGNRTVFINTENSKRVSHLHLSCMFDNPHIVHEFIVNGADINSSISLDSTIYPGFTPLHIAVANCCDKVTELLLQSGADSGKKNKEGQTPLHLACALSVKLTKYIYPRIQIINMLLDFKVNCLDIADEQGNIPLYMEFYRNSEPKAISYMVSKISAKMNFTNDEGLSYFHVACTTNNIKQVKDYLESGVNVNSCVLSGIYSGYTALHFAALHNQKDVVELLLENNAQVNIKTEFQATPLHLACELNYVKFSRMSHSQKDKHVLFPLNFDSTSNRRDQLDIISLLLSHGADVNAKDYQGITPLFHACITDKNYCKLDWSLSSCNSYKFQKQINKEVKIRMKEIANKIFSTKAEVNVHLEGQESILHIISKYENTEELVKFILTKGIDINTVDDAGLTPLHVAVKASNFGMVKVLLENKADVNIKCKDSKIPLHGLFCAQPWSPVKYKIEKDEKKIFSALLNNGSDVNIVVGEKYKPLLHAAIERRHNFMVRQLLNNYADINVEDSLGNSCVSSLFEWDNIISDEQTLQTQYAEVFQTVWVHVQKLKALGLHVSEKVWKCCIKLFSRHKASAPPKRSLKRKLKNTELEAESKQKRKVVECSGDIEEVM